MTQAPPFEVFHKIVLQGLFAHPEAALAVPRPAGAGDFCVSQKYMPPDSVVNKEGAKWQYNAIQRIWTAAAKEAAFFA